MSGPEAGWRLGLGLPEGMPAWAVTAAALLFSYLCVVVPSGAALSYLSRKLTGDLQARVGPNRAGPAGMLQPLVDLMKLLQKDRRPAGSTAWGALWEPVQAMALYSTVATLPLGSLALLVDTDMSAFLPFWAVLVLAFGTLLTGLDQRTVPGWFGGMRAVTQALSGAFPALLAILAAGVQAGGFGWARLAEIQGASPLEWQCFSNPFLALAFVVFVASGMVLLSISPFDGCLAAEDLHGGVGARLVGSRLSLFRLGRFYAFFLWSVVATTLFLGAWRLPGFVHEPMKEAEAWPALLATEMSVVLAKTLLLMLVVTVAARVMPRARTDQATDLAWRVLAPLALFALVGASAWKAFA